MYTQTFRSVLLGSALWVTGLAATAQDVEQIDPNSAAADTSESRQETVTVTGTRIPEAANLIATSPVTSIGASDIQKSGALRVEDVFNSLPQAFGAQGSSLANGATGTASVNLRGLGEERTLVLLNGRRLPYGSSNEVAADVNFIPAALIERVDILTGGASATYGSDAIAGVANFVLDTDFEGLRIDANYSFYNHNNDGELQPLLEEFAAENPAQYTVPSGSTNDGETIDITVAFGSKFESGRGHFSGFFGYQNVNEVLQGSRDYSQCALGTRNDGTEFTCAGSSTNAVANFLDIGSGYTIPGSATIDSQTQTGWGRVNASGGEFEERDFVTDTFNYNPYNHFQRPSERYNFGFFANYKLNDWAEAYGKFMFMDESTNSQIAPSGVFGLGAGGEAGGISCSHPLLSDQQKDYLCGEIADGVIDRYTVEDEDSEDFGLYTDAMGNVLADQDMFVARFDGDPDQAGLDDDAFAPIILLRRNVEGGRRNEDIGHTTYRGLFGVRGDLGNTGLDFDVSASFAKVQRTEVYNNDLSKRRIALALDAVELDDDSIVCAINADDSFANDDASCVPYDPFTGNPPDPASLAYITQQLNLSGETTQSIVTAQIHGDLGQYGLRFPSAEDGVNFAVGLEYRRDSLDARPDAAYQSGDGAGQGGPILPVSGSQDVVDLFFEAKVPVIQGQPLVEALGFDVAFRGSQYESDTTEAYKFGGEYAPSEDIRFRASYQRAVRAPNIFELFEPAAIGLFDLTAGENDLYDPCAGPAPARSLEECQRTGVTAAQYGTIGDNPAGQFNTLEGGNPDLDPETSDTYTFGFVATPSMVPGLTVSVDYFDISVEDYINTVPEELSLTQCLDTGAAFFCDLINRGAGGTLWANSTGYIEALDINTGEISTSGVDVLLNYTFELPSGGDLAIDYVGTYLESLEVKPLKTSTGDEIFDCAGAYGARCQSNFGTGSNPEYRHKIGLDWMPNDALTLSTAWRYFSEVTLDQSTNTDSPNHQLDAQSYFDLSGRYQWNENTVLRAGVNNVFDRDPPLSSVVGTAPGNGNTYPEVYDALGRYLFIGTTLSF